MSYLSVCLQPHVHITETLCPYHSTYHGTHSFRNTVTGPRSKIPSGTQLNIHHFPLSFIQVLSFLVALGGNSNIFWIWNFSLSSMLSLTIQTNPCTLSSISTICASHQWSIYQFINTLLWFLLSFIIVLWSHNSYVIKFMFYGIQFSGFYCIVFQSSPICNPITFSSS